MKLEHINLLIVDDEAAFLASISRSLELRGLQVHRADRGDIALQIARENPIDIALVDLKMPGMNGQETLEALKKEHPWMEIVILTGHGTIDSAAACTRSGAYAYLQKPCEFEILLETLVQAYKKRVMAKKQIEEKKLDAILKISLGDSPRRILEKLAEFDQQG
jgi:DNA-binding NtrC family response regulator